MEDEISFTGYRLETCVVSDMFATRMANCLRVDEKLVLDAPHYEIVW